ncbi:MAG: OmpA family protein [Bacteroidota bacterium]
MKYAELLKIDSTNPMYNFEQAKTYYSNYQQPKSISYFKKSIKYSKDTIGETFYFLANAYHLTENFNQAEKYYKIYLSLLETYGTEELMQDEEDELKNNVRHSIEMCNYGKELIKFPIEKITINGKTNHYAITNVGRGVNSDFDDYGTVFSANDSVMYFTTRREGSTGNKLDLDNKYFEDIYVSGLSKKGIWGQAFNIGPSINTKKHEAVISIAPDGKKIYFYKGVRQGTFFYSNLLGNAWTKPDILFKEANVNTKAWETSFFGFTLAGNELYIVSDKEDGIGGRDIYLSKKQSDGSWGELVNLGEPINTKYDEDAVYISQDGNTMYFSSTGHNSMGGFDIFKSEKQNGKWMEPQNIGYPINTPRDDIYFTIANKNDRIYYSSSAHAIDGTCDMDIYAIDFCDEFKETKIKGLAIGITKGTITVTEKESGKEIKKFDIENSIYSMKLEHGKNYRFTLNTTGIEPAHTDIYIPKQCKVYDIYQELVFTQPGQPFVFKNAFFNIESEFANSGTANYSEFLSKVDKTKLPLYNEVSVNTSAIIIAIKKDTAKPVISTTIPESIATETTKPATTTTTTTTSGTSSTVTTISINNILFDYDKSDIKKEFTFELDKVVNFLKNTNKKAKIEVAGHTDSKGSENYNLALSKRRANAVAVYLSSKGIDKSRMKTIGYGESKPIAVNENPDGSDNPEGRTKNRRTEIVIQ